MFETINNLVDSLTDGAPQTGRYQTSRGTRLVVNYVHASPNHGQITDRDVAVVTNLDGFESDDIAADIRRAGTNTAVANEFALKARGFTHPLIKALLVLGAISVITLIVILGPAMLVVLGIVAMIVAPLYMRNRWEQINQYDLRPGVAVHEEPVETIEDTRVLEYESDVYDEPVGFYQDDPYANRI